MPKEKKQALTVDNSVQPEPTGYFYALCNCNLLGAEGAVDLKQGQKFSDAEITLPYIKQALANKWIIAEEDVKNLSKEQKKQYNLNG